MKVEREKLRLDRLRLDKWLWAARFFKTRKLAGDAISGGKVHVNGERIKPSRNIRCGDVLDITRGEEHFEVTVAGLNDKRRPASEARMLYEESSASVERREAERETRRLLKQGFSSGARPDKHGRRALRRIHGRE